DVDVALGDAVRDRFHRAEVHRAEVHRSGGGGFGADGCDGGGDDLDGALDVVLGGEAAEGEADGGEGEVVREAHRGEDVAGPGGLRVAGAPGGDGEAAHRGEELRGAGAGEGEV